MKKIIFCVLVVVSGLSFYSCKKGGSVQDSNIHQADNSDDIFPVVTINKPVANQVFTSGDSIIIEGKCTDEKKVYKGKVQLKNDATSSIVAENYYQTQYLTAINFRVAYKATVAVSTDYTVFVEFEDHGLNVATTSFKVKVNP